MHKQNLTNDEATNAVLAGMRKVSKYDMHESKQIIPFNNPNPLFW